MVFAFEGARGIAALMVAIYHVGNLSQFQAFRHMYLCVDLFFVLSGWVIASNYWYKLDRWEDVKVFVVRRSGRLLPLLFFSTFAYILMINLLNLIKYLTIVSGSSIRPESLQTIAPFIPNLTQLFGVLTLTHGLGFFHRLFLNSPSWSISTEFYTYLIFALCCLWFKDRLRIFFFILLFLVGAAITITGSYLTRNQHLQRFWMDVTYDFGFYRCIWSFFMGALAFRFRDRITAPKWILQWGSLALMALAVRWIEAHQAVAFAFPILFVLFVFSISTDQGSVARGLNLKFLQMLGTRSYSLYLMHEPLNLFFKPITSRLEGRNFGFQIAEDLVFVLMLIVLSGLTFKYIEDPFRRKFKRKTLPAPPLLEVGNPVT